MFDVLGPGTTPSVSTVAEPSPRFGLSQPCKNVDLQTRMLWGSANGTPGWSQLNSGYAPVALVPDEAVTVWLQSEALPGSAPGIPLGGTPGPSAGTSGWFFAMPATPHPPPDYESRRLMRTGGSPFGSVINLNPCCFGEVYWVGALVGATYMAFAVWLPYSHWVQGDLPVVVHFRPFYNDRAYDIRAASGVPAILARDAAGHQPFLDAAWLYLLGQLAFVQQMLSARRVSILVYPVPPKPTAPDAASIYPDEFRNNLVGVVGDAIKKAAERAGVVGAGTVSADLGKLIFSANSQGGAYLLDVANKVRSGLREVWMFDADAKAMQQAFTLTGMVRRLYVAQSARRGNLFNGGQGVSWEKQGDNWSTVDISSIPTHGSNLHDVCGRICFSHASALSPTMASLQIDPTLMDKTLTDATDCWGDRQEFWKKRGP